MRIKVEAPVLLIIFNRPETTQLSFDAIRKAKPAKLYVSADAPRIGNDNDRINCEKAREIVKKVDWDCNVCYRFLDVNMGCGMGVSSGISWAFEYEDRLIILEDDCIPSSPFFNFCNHCLEKYKYDTRVFTISGRSHHSGLKNFKIYDYIFSHYFHCWGWATWKRVWKNFNIDMDSFPEFMAFGGFYNSFFSYEEAKFFNKLYSNLFQKSDLKRHTWDFQFNYYGLSNAGLSIVPSQNLIQNIGSTGTHSTGKQTFVHKLKSAERYSIQAEPSFIIPNRDYEHYHFRHHIYKMSGKKSLYKRAIDLPKRIIRKCLKIVGLLK